MPASALPFERRDFPGYFDTFPVSVDSSDVTMCTSVERSLVPQLPQWMFMSEEFKGPLLFDFVYVIVMFGIVP